MSRKSSLPLRSFRDLKKIETWLNQDQYERFLKKCEKAGKSPYSFLKNLVLKELNGSE